MTMNQDDLTEFMKAYEKANNSHIWSNVEPFITNNATYWFTDGSFSGIGEIKGAIQSTFDKIQDETYTISDIQWIVRSDAIAVCAYTFHWEGTVGGVKKNGSGRGTNVLVKNNDTWQIAHEHLSS
jgi:predicted ester cyclase